MAIGIFAVESMWTPDKSDGRTSVKPFIEAVCMNYSGTKHTCWPVLAPSDLEVRLQRGPKRGFGILYIAAHGKRGYLDLSGGQVTLEMLSGMMKRRYEGWSVHFASCLVMGATEKRLKEFKRSIGAHVVSGYTTAVEWEPSGVLEMAWLSSLVAGRNRLPKYCDALAELTGFIKI